MPTQSLRLLVTGSRDCRHEHRIHNILHQEIYTRYGRNVVLISGGARGADTFCESFATMIGWDIERHTPDWRTHGRRAGYLRNKEMVDSQPDRALAFIVEGAGNRGTRMTIDLCHDAGVDITVHNV